MNSHELCYYCGKNKPDVKYLSKKMIYSKLDSNYGIGLLGIKKTTRYYEKEFAIDRCIDCYIEHKRPNRPAWMIALTVLVISGIITYYFALRVYIAVIVGIVCGIFAMILYFTLVYRKRIKAMGIKDENEIDTYPPIKDLLDNGWQTYKP